MRLSDRVSISVCLILVFVMKMGNGFELMVATIVSPQGRISPV